MNGLDMDAPCKGCKTRHLGCHDDCPLYLEFRKKVEQANEDRRRCLKSDEFARPTKKRRWRTP